MLRRTLLVAALAAVLAPAGLAATVHVRVEGKTRTIFGPTEVTVTAANALDALEQASLLGEFYYHVTQSSFGPYVDQVGRYGAGADTGWVFKVDNASPPVGADKVVLKDGDTVLWYYGTFSQSGGPLTLAVKATTNKCYVATAYDDSGKAQAGATLTWRVGSKRTSAGAVGKSFCPGPHPGALVRATADGAVRSNAVK